MKLSWSDLPKQSGTCLVVGNGPSLKDIPIRFLQAYPSFGTNRIYLLKNFIPTYYACVNPLVLEQYLFDIITYPCRTKFVREAFAEEVPGAYPLNSTSVPLFSRHADHHVYEGHTVTYVCLQIAYWLGFTRVLLVGIDHSYKFSGGSNEENVLVGEDPNHFSPDYFQGARWNNPDLAMSEKAYVTAKMVYSLDNREIINCSTVTSLKVFPTGSWKDFMTEGEK